MSFSLRNIQLHFLNTLTYLQHILRAYSSALPSQSQFVLSYCLSSFDLFLTQQELLNRCVSLQHFIVESTLLVFFHGQHGTQSPMSLVAVDLPSVIDTQCCSPSYMHFQNTVASEQGTVRPLSLFPSKPHPAC